MRRCADALFAIGDEELLEWKQRFGRVIDPASACLASVPDSGVAIPRAPAPIADALRVLQQLHRRRNYVPVAETMQELLDATRAHVGFVLRSGGEQALANVLHVAELARQYEAGGGISFRGFVDELRVAAENAQAAEAPILEEGSDGVRMMTVHKAKGLEFPIVILADLTCKLSRARPAAGSTRTQTLCALKLGGWAPIDLLLHDAEEARARSGRGAAARLRRRDARARLLVVPAIGDGPYDGGWLDPLMPAIYPAGSATPRARARAGLSAVHLERLRAEAPRRRSRAPRHRRARHVRVLRISFRLADHSDPRSTGSPAIYSVTWWDPRSARISARRPRSACAATTLIVKDGDMFAVEDRLADYERGARSRRRVVEQAQRPSVRVQTATAWAADGGRARHRRRARGDADDRDRRARRRRRRPARAAFRHAGPCRARDACRSTPAPTTCSRDRARRRAGCCCAPAEESRRGRRRRRRRVLGHDLHDARAGAPRVVRRETPVSWLQKDGTLIEGVLDLAFDEGGVTIVVDFKTDHELAAGESRYRAQLQQYVSAVARATGGPARGILFKV